MVPVDVAETEADNILQQLGGGFAEELMQPESPTFRLLAQGDQAAGIPGEFYIEPAAEDDLRVVPPEEGADFFLGLFLF
jgi:hypothetical protein